MVVEVPISHTTEVAAVSFFWLEVEVGEYVFYVFPVLHKKAVGVVDNCELDRRKVIVVLFLGPVEVSSGYNREGGFSYSSLSIAVRRPRGLAKMISEL